MRETFIAANGRQERAAVMVRGRASHSPRSHSPRSRPARPTHERGSASRVWQSVGLAGTGLLFDVSAVAGTAVLLWIGAGASVFQGQPVLTGIAFLVGVIVLALAQTALRQARDARVGYLTHGILVVVVLGGGYWVYTVLGGNYFTAWALVLGACTLTAGDLIDVVVAIIRGRRAEVFGHLIAVPFCVAAVVLLNVVWAAPGFLADLTVFTVLVAAAARLVAVGISAYRHAGPVSVIPGDAPSDDVNFPGV